MRATKRAMTRNVCSVGLRDEQDESLLCLVVDGNGLLLCRILVRMCSSSRSCALLLCFLYVLADCSVLFLKGERNVPCVGNVELKLDKLLCVCGVGAH